MKRSVDVMYIPSPPLKSQGETKDLPFSKKEGKATATVLVILRDSFESFFILAGTFLFVKIVFLLLQDSA